MSLVKDLLLLLVTIMHISLMASSPAGPRSCVEKLDRQAGANKHYISNLLKDLNYAKSLFIERLYCNTTRETKTKSLKPLDGITIPARNTNVSSILNSMHEISECLTGYLPNVIGHLTTHEDVKTNILSYTSPFLVHFEHLSAELKDCWEKGELKVCPKDLANNQTGYEMKEHALGVLHTAVKWTESYVKMNE